MFALRLVPITNRDNNLKAIAMINLAIVIAVSDYTLDAQPLPGCKNDGTAIASLFEASGKFSEVLLISEGTASDMVKQQLIDFVTRHRSSGAIGDLVFYFTGHGDFREGEFYYLLSDYSAGQRKQTSLENSELDNLIRSLRPTLFAKIVDACHSGLSDTYCTEDEAMATLEAVADAVKQYEFPPDLRELYTLRSERVAPADFRYAAGIGRWIDKNTPDKIYFAKPKKEMRPIEKRVPKNSLAGLAGYPGLLGNLGDDDYKTITEYKEYVTGIEQSVDMPYGALAIFADPMLLNLYACRMYLAPIVSMTHIRLFWSYAYLDHQSWKQRKFISSLEWITDEAPTKDFDKISGLLGIATEGFENFVFAPLRAKWGKLLEPEDKQSLETPISQAPKEAESGARRADRKQKEQKL